MDEPIMTKVCKVCGEEWRLYDDGIWESSKTAIREPRQPVCSFGCWDCLMDNISYEAMFLYITERGLVTEAVNYFLNAKADIEPETAAKILQAYFDGASEKDREMEIRDYIRDKHEKDICDYFTDGV